MLLGERQLRDSRESAGGLSGVELGDRQLLAVKRRAFEEVDELVAVARIVERELIRPLPCFDVSARI